MLNVLLAGSTDDVLLAALRERQLRAAPCDMAALDGSLAKAPDAIVVDIRSTRRLPPELASVRRRFPNAGLVIVAGSADPSLLLEAMRLGVNEWVAEPIVPDELVTAIRRVATGSAGPAGKTFAILGAKGGVGSTTVAVNLATSMTMVSKEAALLIDLHMAYGDAAVFFGVDPRFSVADALENVDRLDETYLRGLISSTPSGVDLLASSQNIRHGVFEASRIRRLLDVVSTMYRFVVLDCPKTEPAVLEAIDGVSQIVVVANQELPSLRSVTRIVTTLKQRCGADRVKVALTRFDPQAEITKADIEKILGGTVAYQFPNDYRTSSGAITRGEPLIVANHSRLAASIGDFARHLGGFPKPQAELTKSGLFGRLGGRR